MLAIWENNKKFILTLFGSLAVIMVFVWMSISKLNAAQDLERSNKRLKREIGSRMMILAEEEGENLRKKEVLNKSKMVEILSLIECRENLGPVGSEDPVLFLKSMVSEMASDLRKKSENLGTTEVTPSKSRSKSSPWELWQLPRPRTLDKDEIHELKQRIYITSEVLDRAINAGLAKIYVKKQDGLYHEAVPGSDKVLRKTPVTVEVYGSYQNIIKFIGSVQQKGFYLQITDGEVIKSSQEGSVKGRFTLAGLEYVKMEKKKDAQKSFKRPGKTWRERDY